jgi:hypothetical protein
LGSIGGVIPLSGQSGERGLHAWGKVFWFFFSKKNILRAGMAGRPREKERQALLFEKRSKNFCPFWVDTPTLRSPDGPDTFVRID